MTQLQIDSEGPGSYESIREHIEAVLRENFELNEERKTWPGDYYEIAARGMAKSILHRLEIKVPGHYD